MRLNEAEEALEKTRAEAGEMANELVNQYNRFQRENQELKEFSFHFLKILVQELKRYFEYFIGIPHSSCLLILFWNYSDVLVGKELL